MIYFWYTDNWVYGPREISRGPFSLGSSLRIISWDRRMLNGVGKINRWETRKENLMEKQLKRRFVVPLIIILLINLIMQYGSLLSSAYGAETVSITATEEIRVAYGDLGNDPSGYCRQLTAETNAGETTYLVCVETNVSGMYQTGLYTYTDIQTSSNDLLRKALYYGHTVGNQTTKQEYYGIANSQDGIVIGKTYPLNNVNGVRDIAMEVQGIGWKDSRTSRNDLKAYLITHHAASKIFIDAALAKSDATWTWNMNSELREATLTFIDTIKNLPSPPSTFKVYLAYPPSGAWSQAYAFPLMEPITGKVQITKNVTGTDAKEMASGNYKFRLINKSNSELSYTLDITIKDGEVQGSGTLSLVEGIYSVEELEAPENVSLAESIPDVTVTAGETSRIEVEDNIPEGGLEITKKVTGDTEGNNGIFGEYVFELEDINDSTNIVKVSIYVTKSTGTTSSKTIGLKAGTYKVRELSCPDACEIDPDIPNVTVKPGETAKLEVTNNATTRPPETGGFRIKKVASSYPINEDPSEYDYAGAVFGIYKTESDANGDVNRLKTLTTDAEGYTDYITGLNAGEYYVRELEAPPGFYLSDKVIKVNLGEGITGSVSFPNERKQVSYVSLHIVKTIDPEFLDEFKEKIAENPEDYSLIGAEYTVYSDEACTQPVKVLRTIKSMGGRRAVQYASDGTTIMKEGENYEQIWPIPDSWNDPSTWGFDSEWDLYKNRIEYPIERRFSTTEAWKPNPGTYYIKETKASPGFALDKNIYEYEVYNSDGGTSAKIVNINRQKWNPFYPQGFPFDQGTVWSVEEPVSNGYLSIVKESTVPDLSSKNSMYDMTGIKYTVYETNEGSIEEPKLSGQVGELIIESYDRDTSLGTSNVLELPSGKYWIQENEDSVEGTGFKWNDAVKEVEIGGGETVELSFDGESGDSPKYARAEILIKKYDDRFTDNVSDEILGSLNLEGAEFRIEYFDSDSPDEESFRTWTFKTDKDGKIDFSKADKYLVSGDELFKNENGEFVFPIGSIVIKETAAAEGYLINDDVHTIQITEEDLETIQVPETPIMGGVRINKIDSETGEYVSQGWANLKDIEITIYNAGALPVVVNEKVINPGEPALVLKSNEEGIIESGRRELPYGIYEARETKAPFGYELDDSWNETFEIKDDDTIIEGLVLSDDVLRQDLKFYKTDMNGNAMQNIPFLISRLDEKGNIVEQHVIVSDESGCVDTSAREKTNNNLNKLDEFVKGGRFTDESMLDSSSNVWFGEHPSDEGEKRGSLVFSNYKIEELKCSKNEGMDLLKTYLVSDEANKAIMDSSQVCEAFKGEIIDLSNVFVNLLIHPESNLIDDESNSKELTKGKEVSVTDTFYFDNLKMDQKYKLLTEIFYVDSNSVKEKIGETMSDAWSPKESYSGLTSKGEVKNTVTINTDEFIGGHVDAVDTLYSEINGEFVELTKHNPNLNIESQRLYIPWFITNAADSLTEDNIGAYGTDSEVVDIVTYENLVTDKSYLFRGELRDRDSGEIVTDNNGNPAIVEMELKKDHPLNGEVKMPPFKIDSSKYEGKSLVVTETLIDGESGKTILEHDSLTDEKQTVYYPRIRTSAVDANTNSKTGITGNTLVKDQVIMNNLVPGKSYVIQGSLVYQEDGHLADGTEVKAGDVISRSEPLGFMASNEDMTIELSFEVDANKLDGITGVVFEDLYHNDVLVASHHNIDDEEQTIFFPKVRTKASDSGTKDNVGIIDVASTIIDNVRLTNLTIGESYKVEGRLMNENGSEFLVDGSPVVAESEVFVADIQELTKLLEFTFDSRELEGKSVVVFEKLLHVNNETGEIIEVASHEDLNDKDQRIDYPSGKTEALDSKSETHYAEASVETTIIDTIYFKNLREGVEYTVKGTLMNKETGEPIRVNGETVTSMIQFVPEDADGKIEIPFTFDSTSLASKKIVAFERMEHKDIVVFVHEDINSDEQTVEITKTPEVPDTPPEDKTPPRKNVPPTEPTPPEKITPPEEPTPSAPPSRVTPPSVDTPRTGDNTEFLISLMVFLVALMGILLAIRIDLDDN